MYYCANQKSRSTKWLLLEWLLCHNKKQITWEKNKLQAFLIWCCSLVTVCMKQSSVSTVCVVPEPINHNTLTCAHNICISFILLIVVALLANQLVKFILGSSNNRYQVSMHASICLSIYLSLLNPCLKTLSREYKSHF